MNQNQKAINSILQLFNGSKLEEKVAGVVLANRYLSQVSGVEKAEVVIQFANKVGTEFVLRMVKDVGNSTVCEAAFTFLEHCSGSIPVLTMFRKEQIALIDTLMTTRLTLENRKKFLLVMLSVTLVPSKRNDAHTIVHHVLQTANSNSALQPVEVIELLCVLVKGIKDKPVSLPLQDSATLRALFIQSFHGAAPEDVRDRALTCCRDLLKSTVSDGQRALSPVWTVIGSDSEAKQCKESTEGATAAGVAKDTASTSFPILLCSIVRGELHLLTEELSCLASYDDKAEDGSAANSSTPFPLDKTGDTAVTTSDSNPVATAATDARDDKARMMRTRVARCLAIHGVCMDLLDCVLSLLVEGSGEDDQEEEDANAEPDSAAAAWGSLPYHITMDVKKAVDGCLKELLDFVHECSQCPALCVENIKGTELPVMSGTEVRNVVSRTVQTVTAYAFEDQAMHALVIDKLSCMLACSVVPTGSTGATTSSVFRISGLESADLWSGVTGSESSGLQPDVIQFVISAVLDIHTQLVDGIADRSSPAADRTRQEELLDRLYNKLDALMPRVTECTDTLISKISEALSAEVSASSKSSKKASSSSNNTAATISRGDLSRGVAVAILGLDLISSVLAQKDSDLKTLLRGEGEAAFMSIVYLPAAQLRQLYAAMKACGKQCGVFIKVLEGEFEQSVATMASSGDVCFDDSQVGSEALDVLCSIEQLQSSMQSLTKTIDSYVKISSAVSTSS